MNNQHKNNNILTGQSIICAKDIGGLTQVLITSAQKTLA